MSYLFAAILSSFSGIRAPKLRGHAGAMGILRKNLLMVCLISLLASPAVRAEDVRVTAEVDRTSLELGSFGQLTITVLGSQDVSPVQLPDITGLQTRYLGPATSISMINGQVSTAKAFRYNIYPTAAGRFQIPSLTVMVNGKEYKTDAIFVDVVAGDEPAQAKRSGGPESASIQDRIFVTLGTPKKEYFLNEAIPVTIKLYVNNLPVSNVQYPDLAHAGFVVKAYEKEKQYEQVVGGVRYQLVEFNLVAYPSRTGTLTLGPVNLNCNFVVRKPAVHSGNSLGNFFDDDLVNSFFGNVENRSLTVKSTDLAINILPLPEEGRPADFSGGVGQFNFEVKVGPAEVKAGDPVTVKMNISGTGNWESVKLPSVAASESLKIYEPQARDSEGVKSQEQVVIPLSEKVQEIPALKLTYFDPSRQKYVTVTQGPFPIKVAKAEGGEVPKAVGLPVAEPVSPKEEKLGRDISFIKDYPGSFRRRGSSLTDRPAFWFTVILLSSLWAGLWGWLKLRLRLKTDVRLARRLKAPQQARQGLEQARQHLDRGEQQDFYDVIFKTLQGYFGNRFHVPSGTISLETIRALSAGKPQADLVLENIKFVFADCEQVRYAAIPLDKAHMHSVCQKTEETIDLIERNWR